MQVISTTNSECLNPRRFRSYFTLYMRSERRKLLLGASLFFIFPFLFILFLYYTENGMYRWSEYENFDPFWNIESGVFIIFIFLFMAVSGSWMFQVYTGKRKRLGCIELPASQWEKFLTWWIVCVPLCLVAIFISFWFVDVLRVLWIKAFTPYGDKAMLYPLKNLLSLVEKPYPIGYSWTLPGNLVGLVYSLLIATNAIFALGSVLFHKLSFLKTIGSIFVLIVVYSIIFMSGSSSFFSTGVAQLSSRYDMEPTGNLIFAMIVAAVSLCIYGFCYARMKEEDIIDRW